MILAKQACRVPDNLLLALNLSNARDLSSAGRASALQAEGHRFEPYRSHLNAGVAELADAQDLKSCCSDTVPVRFRSRALFIRCLKIFL